MSSHNILIVFMQFMITFQNFIFMEEGCGWGGWGLGEWLSARRVPLQHSFNVKHMFAMEINSELSLLYFKSVHDITLLCFHLNQVSLFISVFYSCQLYLWRPIVPECEKIQTVYLRSTQVKKQYQEVVKKVQCIREFNGTFLRIINI